MRINKRLRKSKYIVGIDEVGRGPLAGPVAVCAFKMNVNFNARSFGKILDSKKLTAEKREEIHLKLEKLKNEKIVDYSVCFESAKTIDRVGISKAIKMCIDKALKNIKVKPNECMVLLDGGLKAPERFGNQKTIIKGDEKERAIAFASIVAKVVRDREMVLLSRRYENYGFEIHKGYGTERHCASIKKWGLSPEHRRCFCRRFL